MPTHGSLSKAGKVRGQTPKLGKSSTKKKKGPRMTNHKEYIKRFIHKKVMLKMRGKHR